MQIQQGSNGDNGNRQLPDLTNREILKVLLDEITDVRKELKGEMTDVRKELKGEMGELKAEVKDLKTEMGSLRMEVHQNQITFMKNHDDLGRRVAVLEAKK